MPRFTTLYSGSSGNCGVIEHAGQYLLVDMGGSRLATEKGLAALGLEPSGLQGILLTHEHSDHVKGLEVFLRRHKVPVVATAGTLDAVWDAGQVPIDADMVEIEGCGLALGGFEVNAFPTSHDAAGCCGYRVAVGGSVMAIATDLGKMTADVFIQFEGAALVALESNYDREMLRNGRYPAQLKRRISSVTGHLCNDDAAAAVAQLVGSGCRQVALCHLSEENNHPELVLAAVEAALRAGGISHDHGCRLQVMRRYETSDWMEF